MKKLRLRKIESLRLFIIVLLFIGSYNFSVANNVIDSLTNLIQSKAEKDKPLFLNELASKYWFSNPQKSFEYSNEALDISQKYKSEKDISSSIYTLGITHLIVNNNDSAFYYLKSSLSKFRALKDTLKIANNLRALADVYNSISDLDNAQIFFHDAYKLFNKLQSNGNKEKRFHSLYAILLNNFGVFHISLKNYNEAKKYFELSKVYYKQLNDMQGLSIAYFNVGLCWYRLSQIDSCIENYSKSYKIASENNILTIKAATLNGLSETYFDSKNYENALKYVELALPILLSIGDKSGTASAYMLKGKIFLKMNKFDKSLEALELALKYATEIGRLDTKLDLFLILAQNYNNLNDFKTSNEYLTMYVNLNDSLNIIEKTERLTQIDSKFQIERKELENQKIKYSLEIKKLNNNRLLVIIFSLIIMISLITITLIVFRKRNSINEGLNKLLGEKNKELEIMNATKDKFFSIIAHDLKNPLGSFRELTKMLYESNSDFSEDEKMELLELMKNSSNNIYALLENLLEWSRTQQGRIPFHPENIDLSMIADNTIQLFKLTANSKGISLMNLILDGTIIKVDVNLITTVIRNLLSNAIKFTSNNGLIEIGAINDPGSVNTILIYVKDKGIGMRQETIDKLFRLDEHITTLGTNSESGTGLGLILSKEFVEKHGGKIWVESELGIGSIFWFSLPV